MSDAVVVGTCMSVMIINFGHLYPQVTVVQDKSVTAAVLRNRINTLTT